MADLDDAQVQDATGQDTDQPSAPESTQSGPTLDELVSALRAHPEMAPLFRGDYNKRLTELEQFKGSTGRYLADLDREIRPVIEATVAQMDPEDLRRAKEVYEVRSTKALVEAMTQQQVQKAAPEPAPAEQAPDAIVQAFNAMVDNLRDEATALGVNFERLFGSKGERFLERPAATVSDPYGLRGWNRLMKAEIQKEHKRAQADAKPAVSAAATVRPAGGSANGPVTREYLASIDKVKHPEEFEAALARFYGG